MQGDTWRAPMKRSVTFSFRATQRRDANHRTLRVYATRRHRAVIQHLQYQAPAKQKHFKE